MKLHLPVRLLSALLACLSLGGNSYATTEFNGNTYSGNIYTFVGGATLGKTGGLAYGYIIDTTQGDSTGTVNYGSFSSTFSVIRPLFGSSSPAEYNTVRFVAGGTSITDSAGTATYTVLTPSSTITTSTTCYVDFSDPYLGGILVEAGAVNWILRPVGNRNIYLGKSDTTTTSRFVINEDFSLGYSGFSWVKIVAQTPWDIQVATGKTLNVYATTITATSNPLTIGSENYKGTVNWYGTTITTGTITVTGSTFTTNNALTSGAITLNSGAKMSVGGNLTLSAGASLSLDLTGLTADASLISIGGNLTLTDATCTVALSNASSLGAGEYAIVQWNSDSPVTSSSFTTTGIPTNTDAFEYEVYVSGNALRFLVVDMSSKYTWAGGNSGTWTNSDTTGWTATGTTGDTLDQKNLFFTETNAGTVTISDTVTPYSVTFSGGTYTLESANSGKISGTTSLKIGDGADVTISCDNDYTGNTILNGGSLTMGTSGALGTGSILFNGGTLVYSSGVTEDISSRISTASSSSIKVNVGTNDVTWSALTSTNVATLGNRGIEKSGTGSLTVTLPNTASATYTGGITVAEGSLVYQVTTEGNTRTFSGNISVAEGASFQYKDATEGGSSVNNTFSGNLTGAGTITLGYDNASVGGRISLSGDNSGFTGQLVLSGSGTNAQKNEVCFVTANSFGGGTLVLDGLGFYYNSGNTSVSTNIEVTSKGSWFNGNSNQTVTFTGSLSSESDSNLGFTTTGNPSLTVILTGDLTQYLGTLTISSNSPTLANGKLQFGNGGAATLDENGDFINASELKGIGTYIVNYSGTEGNIVSLASAITANCTLSVTGTDSLALTGTSTATGAKLTLTNATSQAQLGTSDTKGTWAGTTLYGAGTFTLVNGALTSAMTVDSGATAKIVVDAAEGKDVDVGRTAGSQLSSITLASKATLTNVNGDITVGANDTTTKLDITLSQSNIREGQAAEYAISQTGKLIINDGASVNLGIDDVVDIIIAHRESDVTTWLTLTSGTIECTDLKNLGTTPLLSSYGVAADSVSGGSILLSGEVKNVYVVDDEADSDPEKVTAYPTLGMYAGTIVAKEKTLTVELAGAPQGDNDGDGAVVNNLVGATGSTLALVNTATDNGDAVVILNNSAIEIPTDDGGTTTIGPNTETAGDITAGEGVLVEKQGTGTLTVDGNVTIAATLKAQEGTLALNGDNSSVASLVLDSTGTATATVEVGGTLTTTLSEEDDGGDLKVTSGGNLKLADTSTLSKSSVTGAGTVTLDSGAKLTLDDTATLDVTKVAMTGGTLDLDESGDQLYKVGTLTGDSASTIELADSTLTVNGTSKSTYSGSFKGKGTLDVENGTMDLLSAGSDGLFLRVTKATVTLDSSGVASTVKALRAASSGSISYDGIELNQSATLILGSSDAADQTLAVGSGGITLNSGSTLVFNTAYATEDDFFGMKPLATTTGNITLNAGSTVAIINSTAFVSAEEETFKVTLMTGAKATVNAVSVTAEFLSTIYENLALSVENGTDVVLSGTARSTSIFEPAALTPNSTSGSNLLWKSRFALAKTGDSPLKDAYLAVSDMVSEGDKAAATRALAAIAGSTVNALGTAQRDALRSQLGWVRNRTVTMGVNPDYTHEDLPYFHMWIEGTGATSKLNTKGDEGGYKLNTWGGTVGVDVDLSDHVTIGAALSAQYGSLSASAAEYATGDLDSYYVSVFGRYQKSAWAHTLILTGSMTDATLDRTVDYGSGSYKTLGDTDGTGLGAMYELTYDIPLNEDKSAIFQPLFNASIVNTTMKAYDEAGVGDAGLNVGKQDWTTATLALGARWMGLVGTNVFGREALLEVRANIAQDFGDDQGETNVALNARRDFTQTVYGAKVGKTAGQFGIGLYLPVGQQGTVFVNGNADVRSGAHSFNGSLGYRYSF